MDFIGLVQEIYLIRLVVLALCLYLMVRIGKKIMKMYFKKASYWSEEKEKTVFDFVGSSFKYIAFVIFVMYALEPVLDLKAVLAGAGVVGLLLGFSLQDLIKDVVLGMIRLYEGQIHNGDFIEVNKKYSGTVEEVGVRVIKMREWSGKLILLSHSQIKEVVNYNKERMRVIERVTVSFREDPQKIKKLLQQLCEELNGEDRFIEFLLKDEEGKPIESYQWYGITSLNDNNHGYEYTVIGQVNDRDYWLASREIREKIAGMLHHNEIRMAESHHHYQARMTTK